jgi:hypothetical protein
MIKRLLGLNPEEGSDLSIQVEAEQEHQHLLILMLKMEWIPLPSARCSNSARL